MNIDKEIEEAFQEYAKEEGIELHSWTWDIENSGFIKGAKWMQEKNAKEIEQLKQRLEIAVEALEKIDRSNDDMKYFNIDVNNIIRETLIKISAEKEQ